MKKYALKRIVTSLFTLLAILLVLFILMQLMPGSPFNDEKLNADQRQAVRDFFYNAATSADTAAAPEPNIADQFPNTAAELEAQYGPGVQVNKNEKEVG